MTNLILSLFLVAAAPPPTAVVDGYIHYLSLLLGVSFSSEEKAQIGRDVAGYFATDNRQAMQTVRSSHQNWVQLQQRPKELVETGMRMTLPDTLLGLKKAAEEGHADSRYLLDRYYQRNPILAAANPGGLPLTRDMVEGDLAVKHWHAREIHRQNAPFPDLQAALQHAVRNHAALRGAEQVQLARQAGEWARIRYAWPRASAMDKLITRSEMGAQLTGPERQQLQNYVQGLNAQINNMASQHQQKMMQSTIDSFKQNTDTIMGRGTVWNPATNRWEQQGGIVTEFNGTVRVP